MEKQVITVFSYFFLFGFCSMLFLLLRIAALAQAFMKLELNLSQLKTTIVYSGSSSHCLLLKRLAYASSRIVFLWQAPISLLLISFPNYFAQMFKVVVTFLTLEFLYRGISEHGMTPFLSYINTTD